MRDHALALLDWVGPLNFEGEDLVQMTYSLPMEAYISARGRAVALMVLTILQLVLLLLATGAWVMAVSAFDNDPFTGRASFVLAAALDGINLLLFVAATVVFLTWVYRSIANLPALGSISCLFAPAEAVGCWFIPFFNLVRGHQVMTTIWRESQSPATYEGGFQLLPKATIVHWWWGLYLLTGVASLSINFTSLSINSHPESILALRSMSSTQVVLHLPRMVTALLFLFMIRGSQTRQDEQWQDVERRRSVPQPSTAGLR